MYLVEYTGEATQFQRISASPGGYYRFGGPKDSASRRFYVHEVDLAKFERNSKFKVVTEGQASAAVQADVEPLPADTQEGPGAQLIRAGLSVPVAALLVEAGYTDPAAVAALSDEELLAIKDIGKNRLASIRKALG